MQAIWESLREAGHSDTFDIFILSDTTNPDIWIEEEAAFLALRRRTGSERIFYRRREKNIARKAGNIDFDIEADWIDYDSAGAADSAALSLRIAEVLAELRAVDPDDLSPRAALDLVARLTKKLTPPS